jgi:hypothetical protein
MPRSGSVLWERLPDPLEPMHRHRPADYALSRAPQNPARQAAGDGNDLGCQAELLPALPEPGDAAPRDAAGASSSGTAAP